MAIRVHKKTILFFLSGFWGLFTGSYSFALDSPDPGMAFVREDLLTVYKQNSTKSKVLTTLRKGDLVRVRLEIMGSDLEGAWCRIVTQGEDKITGFVFCKRLKRDTFSRPRWRRLGESPGRRKVSETKAIIENNHVLIPVKLSFGYSSEEVMLVLDTGASQTMISAEVADRLNINTGRAEKKLFRVVGGALVMGELVKLKSITVGPHTRENMTIAVIREKKTPGMINGLLGLDFLKGFKYYIDFDKKVVEWDER